MVKSFQDFFEEDEGKYREFSEIEVAKLYQQNPNIRVTDLSRLTGRNVNELYRIFKKYSVPASRINTNKHLVISYAEQGYAINSIAELTGYTPRNVYFILKKNSY